MLYYRYSKTEPFNCLKCVWLAVGGLTTCTCHHTHKQEGVTRVKSRPRGCRSEMWLIASSLYRSLLLFPPYPHLHHHPSTIPSLLSSLPPSPFIQPAPPPPSEKSSFIKPRGRWGNPLLPECDWSAPRLSIHQWGSLAMISPAMELWMQLYGK